VAKRISLTVMQSNKGRPYSFLAGLSLLFLMGFLIYWNVDNYNRTKQELKQDLSVQMDLSIAQYQDSLIQGIFRLIEIDSSGTPTFNATYTFARNGNMHELSTQTHNVHGVSPSQDVKSIESGMTQGDSSLTVMYDSVNDRKIVAWNKDISHFQSSFEIIIDTTDITGINLHDAKTIDSLSKQIAEIGALDDSTKTILPKIYARINEIYIKRLQDAQLPTDHIVTTLAELGTPDTPSVAIAYSYGTLTGDSLPYAVFEQSGLYVLKQRLPSIILSMLLFSSVATSFFIILKNWKNQLQLTAVKEEFISNMTHELKTPISTVGVALEALENFGVIDDKEKRKEYLDISKHELHRLRILVDKVIKMSTLDQDLDVINFEDIDLRQITEDTIHSMSLLFKKSNAVVACQYKGDDFIVLGNRVHLVNVLYNIIDNAIKYSGDSAQINVDIEASQHEVTVSIQDHGPGIDQAYLPKIFDRLFRVPSHDQHNVKGHGLGLHYAKTVIEKHKGTITAWSKKETGTTFLIKIPKNLD